MGIYLDDYPGALEPCRTPFDEGGKPAQPCVFIYMTKRYEGRWSYLMPPGFEQEHDPAGRIGMGDTQLWIMEKRFAAHPSERPLRLRAAHAPTAPSFEDGVTRDDFGSLFHLFREPTANLHDHNDHLGARRRLPDAVRYAHRYADHRRCHVVVARLLHDWTWH